MRLLINLVYSLSDSSSKQKRKEEKNDKEISIAGYGGDRKET